MAAHSAAFKSLGPWGLCWWRGNLPRALNGLMIWRLSVQIQVWGRGGKVAADVSLSEALNLNGARLISIFIQSTTHTHTHTHTHTPWVTLDKVRSNNKQHRGPRSADAAGRSDGCVCCVIVSFSFRPESFSQKNKPNKRMTTNNFSWIHVNHKNVHNFICSFAFV